MLLIKTPCLQAEIQSYECTFHSCPSNIAVLLPNCKGPTIRNTAINVETRRSLCPKVSTRMVMQTILRLSSKMPRWLIRPFNSAFAMRNMPRLAKLDEVWNEVSSCATTCRHTSSPKVLRQPKLLRQVYHHQYLTRAPRHSLAPLWIRGLHQRVKHK